MPRIDLRLRTLHRTCVHSLTQMGVHKTGASASGLQHAGSPSDSVRSPTGRRQRRRVGPCAIGALSGPGRRPAGGPARCKYCAIADNHITTILISAKLATMRRLLVVGQLAIDVRLRPHNWCISVSQAVSCPRDIFFNPRESMAVNAVSCAPST